MGFQCKRLWKRWISRHCKHNYVLRLPRHHNPKRIPCCKFLGGFYCVTDSLIPFLVIFAALLIIVLYLCGYTITDFRYFAGLIPTVEISVSMLDSWEHVNFINGEPRTEYVSTNVSYDANDYASSLKLAKSGKVILWKVEGYSQYIDNSSDINIPGVFGNLPLGQNVSSDIKSKSQHGFWIFEFGRSTINASKVGSISALSISDHFSNAALNEVEVAVAIRAYVFGEATIVIKYEHSLSSHTQAETIKSEDFKNKGLCYKILDLPFEKKINSIYIRPTSTNLRRRGFVVVDKVYIVVATRGTTESLIHTLVPDNWC